MIYYFAFGSNISEYRMITERKINYISRNFAVLNDYKLVFNKMSKKNNNLGFANVVESKGDIVEGALYELSLSDIRKIDKFEGALTKPCHYYRKTIEVVCNGKKIQAITYIANPIMVKENIKPDKNYLNYILEGKDIFTSEYYEKLNLTKTLN